MTSEDHEYDEVEDHESILVLFWLHVDSYSIYAVVHDVYPTFGTHHFKKCANTYGDIIEVLCRVDPFAIKIETILLGYNLRTVVKTTLVKLTLKLIYSHNSKN